jgi:hypothetical protein
LEEVGIALIDVNVGDEEQLAVVTEVEHEVVPLPRVVREEPNKKELSARWEMRGFQWKKTLTGMISKM